MPASGFRWGSTDATRELLHDPRRNPPRLRARASRPRRRCHLRWPHADGCPADVPFQRRGLSGGGGLLLESMRGRRLPGVRRLHAARCSVLDPQLLLQRPLRALRRQRCHGLRLLLPRRRHAMLHGARLLLARVQRGNLRRIALQHRRSELLERGRVLLERLPAESVPASRGGDVPRERGGVHGRRAPLLLRRVRLRHRPMRSRNRRVPRALVALHDQRGLLPRGLSGRRERRSRVHGALPARRNRMQYVG